MMTVHLDFESRSRVDITKVGAWRYASDPSTEITCIGLAINDAAPVVTRRESVISASHVAHFLQRAARIAAHNAGFEYAMYYCILQMRHGWPPLLDPKKWDCTQARALLCGLPSSLEGVALTLRLPFKKDLAGYQAMMKTCKPNPKTGEWNEDPETYETLYRYNAIDVEVERAADKALPPLPPEERKLFELDMVINRRGLGIDLRSCEQATEIAKGLTDGLNEDLWQLTGGAVSKASKVEELKRWVAARGVAVPTKPAKVADEDGTFPDKETLDIEAVKDLIKDPKTPEIVKQVVGIRQQVGKSSVSKFKSMTKCACADGRVRGAFQYHGAHTGRWAGRLIQPTNYPQGFSKETEQEAAVAMLGQGVGFYRAVYAERAMQTLSNTLRGMIIPAPGKVFVNRDLNAIECRVLNWLAGETWVMDLFAAGGSPYLRMAETIFGKTGLTKAGDPYEYDIGKRSELGDGFGMGWRRFQGNVYTETSKRGVGVWLEDDLCQRAVKIYRQLHKHVVDFWYATEDAAVRAVQNPGQIFATAAGRVLWSMSADRYYLVCRLPSGRLLRYFRPEIGKEDNPKGGDPKPSLHYWTKAGEGALKTDPSTNGILGQYRTWGGELVENVVQATARDFMTHGMVEADKAGLKIVLHNYDELCAEVDEKDAETAAVLLERCMTENLPEWTAGCPVKAEGWSGKRYRK